MTHKLVPLSTAHLADVWRIEQSAHSHPWAKSMIDDLQSRGACHYGLVQDEKIVGYFYAQHVVGEVTLLNIAVDPAKQQQGFGRQLMDHFIEVCEQLSAESAWLEVRESNLGAFKLYESLGFNEVDRRRNYYPKLTNSGEKSKEDAIIMSYMFFSF